MLKIFEKKPMMVVLMLIGIVGVLFATLIIIYTEFNKEIRTSLLDREIEHQESRAANFVLEIGENYKILGSNVGKLMPNDLSNGISENRVEILKDAISEEVSDFERISVYDKNDLVLYQDETGKEFNFDKSEYSEEVRLSKQAIITKGFDANGGKYYFAYINPVFNDNNEFEGCIKVIFSAETFFNELTFHLSSVEQYLTVIDRDGFILFSVEGTDIGTHVFDDVVLEKFDFDQNMIENAQRVILQGETRSYPYPTEFGLFMSTGTSININGNQIFAIYLTVPVYAIVTFPQTAFDNVQYLTLIVILFVAGIIGLLFWVISRMSNKEHKLRVQNIEKDLKIAKQDKLITIGELTSRIAHDLRNSLNTLKNSTELVQHYENVKPQVQSQMGIMQRSIDRMTHQIDDVLGFVKKTKACLFYNQFKRIT